MPSAPSTRKYVASALPLLRIDRAKSHFQSVDDFTLLLLVKWLRLTYLVDKIGEVGQQNLRRVR